MFKNEDSLKAYIRNESGKNHMSSQRGCIYYFTRQFLTNLYQSTNIFTIAGNIAQSAVMGIYSRPISDIDMISGNSIEEITDRFYDSLKIVNNGIAYDLMGSPTISNSGICNITLKGIFGKIEQPVGIDIKSEAPRRAVQVALPKLFSRDDDLEIQAVSHELQLGRKLYVIG